MVSFRTNERTNDRQTDRPNSATMPPSHKLGDVTSLLSVKVRPRLNKGLNHCHCLSERILGNTRHRRQGPSNTRHTPTRHQTPPEPSPKPLLTYALTPPAPRYPHSRHLPLLPPPLLPVELPTPLSPLSPLSRFNAWEETRTVLQVDACTQ